MLAAYTFSKTLTDADSAFPFFSVFQSNNFAGTVQNPFNLKTEKAVSLQDTPHAVVISYLYELPAGPGKKYLSHGVGSKVLGGWQIGGVHRYQSGTPTLFNTFAPSPVFSGGNFKFSRIPGVPIYSPNKSSFNPVNCAAFFDQNAPGLVAQRGYQFGNLPTILGNIRSQHYFSEDFSIIKRTAISETHWLIFKADIPNAFNRHIFGALDGNILDNNFGIPNGPRNVVNAIRQIQLTLRYQF